MKIYRYPLHTNETYLKIALIILCFITLLVFQNFQEHLIFAHNKITSGEIWRLWSGQFVHTNYIHLTMNIVGFITLLILYSEELFKPKLIIQIFYISTCIGLWLYFFSPEVRWYLGLSGIIYGLFVVASLQAIIQKDALLGYPLFIAITVKITWENVDNSINNTSASLINSPIATDAHLYGYIAALTLTIITITLTYFQKEK